MPPVRLATLTLALVLAASVSLAPAAHTAPRHDPQRPNIVFVLTDDLSWNLIRYMPHVRQMQREGMTFTNYFVTDSLCCPSRASIFTGRYPHNHRVLTNTPPSGGFAAFHYRGDQRTFATALAGDGYRTAMMGKYLNGYQAPFRKPPGWNDWQVTPGGYRGFDYELRTNGRIAHFGRARRAYITDVLRRRGMRFMSTTASARRPFMIEIATLAPHRPATPAPRDAHDFPGLQVPRGPTFDHEQTDAPSWLRGRPPLPPAEIVALDNEYRRRAQSVQAVDEMVGQIRRLLRQRGLAKNTYFVFSSDNGYHMGDRRLYAGKMTAYDSDIRVPLIVVGPGVKPGSVSRELAENVDLAPTFERLAGGTPPARVDGRSLTGVLHGRTPDNWRDAVLIEHHHPESPIGDPDHQTQPSGNPPSYEALRTTQYLYVEYVTGDREFYDLQTDPFELHNRYGELDGDARAILHGRLVGLENCRGPSCRALDSR
jgi:N-acetylglucosamine-6-sulfatase